MGSVNIVLQGGKKQMSNVIKKYHKDVYWKKYFDQAAFRLITADEHLSNHLENHIRYQDYKHNIDYDKLSDIINHLYYNTYNKKFTTVFEVETLNGMVTKAVIRTPYDNHYDICLVLRNSIVVTAWLCQIEDIHYTLDYTQYSTK